MVVIDTLNSDKFTISITYKQTNLVETYPISYRNDLATPSTTKYRT